MTPWHTWNPQADPKAPLAWDGPGVVRVSVDPSSLYGMVDSESDRAYAVAALKPELLFVFVVERPVGVARYFLERSGSPPPGGTSAGITPAMIYNAATGIRGRHPAFWTWPLPNVIHMAKVTTQAEADARLPALLRCPGLRGVWAEPGEALDLTPWVWRMVVETYHGDPDPVRVRSDKLHLVAVAGQTGPAARPCHPEWVRSLRDQAGAAGVAFNFRGWGDWKPISEFPNDGTRDLYKSRRIAKPHEDQDTVDEFCGRRCTVENVMVWHDGVFAPPGDWPKGRTESRVNGVNFMQSFRIGKESAGRTLDGVTHDGLPAWGGRAEA